MSVPQFPPGECYVTASPHVFVHRPPYDGCGYRVWFKVGVQYFRISEFDSDELEEAQAHARTFVKALENYRAETSQ